MGKRINSVHAYTIEASTCTLSTDVPGFKCLEGPAGEFVDMEFIYRVTLAMEAIENCYLHALSIGTNSNDLVSIVFPEFFYRGMNGMGYYYSNPMELRTHDRVIHPLITTEQRFALARFIANQLAKSVVDRVSLISRGFPKDQLPFLLVCFGTMPIGSGCPDEEKSRAVRVPVMQLDNFALTMSWEPQGHLVSNAFFKRNPSQCDYLSLDLRRPGPYVPGWRARGDVGLPTPLETFMPINHINFCYAHHDRGRIAVSPLIKYRETRGHGPEFPSYFFMPNTLSSLADVRGALRGGLSPLSVGMSICLDHLCHTGAGEFGLYYGSEPIQVGRDIILITSAGLVLEDDAPITEAKEGAIIIQADGIDRTKSAVARVRSGVVVGSRDTFEGVAPTIIAVLRDEKRLYRDVTFGTMILMYRGQAQLQLGSRV